ncbi:hypothetical protein ACNIS8_26330, partial [Escherichia coli]
KRAYCLKTQPATGETYPKSDLFNKAEQKGKQLKAVAMKCIPFNKNDIHTWDSPLSEPIYYEKVKQTIDNSMLKILHTLK